VSSRRIALVTSQLLGFDRSGGVGAATAFLTLALARLGHDVEVIYIKEQLRDPLDREWARRYEDVGATIRRAPALDVGVEPWYFARMRAVELALRARPPDVVIAHEYGAPAYIALRLRQLGLAFQDTLFVAYCHGTGPWLKEVTGNARISPEMVAVARLEQAGAELADVAVSPSAYMVGWMRRQDWRLPEARVIPLVTRATAMGEPSSTERDVSGNGRVERLAFFGHLHAVKGVEPFVGALNTLPPELLEGIELEFLGGSSKNWDPARVAARMSERTTHALRRVSFETELGREEALARLRLPGTLAVMPSLAENSPNVIYECLEARIPFLASSGGGIGELVAVEDRERVLFQPTVEGVSAALRRALVEGGALRPVRPAFDQADVLSAWAQVVATEARRRPCVVERSTVDVIVHERGSRNALERCLSALDAQTYDRLNVIRSTGTSVTAARELGLQQAEAEWVIFLDEEDVPTPELVETLVRAQGASGADVVSCGILHHGGERFFAGEPGGVGLLANDYGTAALLRRALLGDHTTTRPVVGDPDWPLLAGLAAKGARVVSVPAPLLSRELAPGTLEREPSDALLVIEALERALPGQLRGVARLAGGLAAAETRRPPPAPTHGLRRRLRRLAGRFF
jgi:glycosyltransferase involved in cell wall biosynthesis